MAESCACDRPPVHDNVKDYYGKRIKSSDDLLTSCCTVDRATFSSEAKEAFKQIHPDVLSKNYGCGAVYPEAVEGCKVLDLGSGAGLDCFVLSKLVGPKGHVTGVDMTKEQLEVARKHVDYHTQAFGYSEPNVQFFEGFIERLGEAGLRDETFDVIVSNCVVNLSPDKKAVLKEAYRVLKVGGEMYFSDIYCNQDVPELLKQNKILWGECLSGALQWRDLMTMATEIGFAPPVLVTSSLYASESPKLQEMIQSSGCSGLKFCSATYRLMKVDWKNKLAGDSGEEESLVQVQYKGTAKGDPSKIKFSCQASLEVDCPVVLTSSVSALLQNCPRLSPHFTFTPLTAQEGGVPLTPPLTDFVDINPFEVVEGNSCCAPPAAKRPCCGSGTCATAAEKPCCESNTSDSLW